MTGKAARMLGRVGLARVPKSLGAQLVLILTGVGLIGSLAIAALLAAIITPNFNRLENASVAANVERTQVALGEFSRQGRNGGARLWRLEQQLRLHGRAEPRVRGGELLDTGDGEPGCQRHGLCRAGRSHRHRALAGEGQGPPRHARAADRRRAGNELANIAVPAKLAPLLHAVWRHPRRGRRRAGAAQRRHGDAAWLCADGPRTDVRPNWAHCYSCPRVSTWAPRSTGLPSRPNARA